MFWWIPYFLTSSTYDLSDITSNIQSFQGMNHLEFPGMMAWFQIIGPELDFIFQCDKGICQHGFNINRHGSSIHFQTKFLCCHMPGNTAELNNVS